MDSYLFIELLQISLGTRDEISRFPKQQEWQDILDESQRQCVLGFLLDGIEKLPKEQQPPKELLLQWIGLTQILEDTYALQCKRAKELTKHFKDKGYKTCVLKGIGLSQYYPVPKHRQCGDIDLWVLSKSDRKCKREEVIHWLRKDYEVDHVVWHHVDAHFFDDVLTEIHFHPAWFYNPFYNHRLQKWFENQRDKQIVVNEELDIAYPSVQFNAVYSLVHFYHHLIEEGVGLRHVVDYYYILKALPNREKADIVSSLKRLGLFGLSSAVMWVLQEVCNLQSEFLLCEPNEKEGRFILDEMMRGGYFGHYRNDNRKRNSATRMFALLPHYPKEVLWVVPWKLWHKCWRLFNR